MIAVVAVADRAEPGDAQLPRVGGQAAGTRRHHQTTGLCQQFDQNDRGNDWLAGKVSLKVEVSGAGHSPGDSARTGLNQHHRFHQPHRRLMRQSIYR